MICTLPFSLFSCSQELKDAQAELNSLKETLKHHREEIDQYNKESGLMERKLRIAQAGGVLPVYSVHGGLPSLSLH